MQTRSYRKPVALLLCVLVVSLAFLSMTLAASHALHFDCMDEQCTVCALIHLAHSLRQLSLAVLGSLLALIAIAGGFASASHAIRRQKATTPIALKVRMNP